MKMINSENSDMNYYESGTVDGNILEESESEYFRHGRYVAERDYSNGWVGTGLRRSLF